MEGDWKDFIHYGTVGVIMWIFILAGYPREFIWKFCKHQRPRGIPAYPFLLIKQYEGKKYLICYGWKMNIETF